MTTLSNLSPAQLREAADLLERLNTIVDGQLGPTPEYKKPWRVTKKAHWTQTPKGRKRMSAIQRKAWRTRR